MCAYNPFVNSQVIMILYVSVHTCLHGDSSDANDDINDNQTSCWLCWYHCGLHALVVCVRSQLAYDTAHTNGQAHTHDLNKLLAETAQPDSKAQPGGTGQCLLQLVCKPV